jgi:hypothetical protein
VSVDGEKKVQSRQFCYSVDHAVGQSLGGLVDPLPGTRGSDGSVAGDSWIRWIRCRGLVDQVDPLPGTRGSDSQLLGTYRLVDYTVD